jgi:parallel beta-helix repeat protein
MHVGKALPVTAFDVHVLSHPEEDTVKRRILSARRLSVATLIATAVLSGSLTPSAANAATYYVAKTGSDNNSCSSAQYTSAPKLTIKSGMSCLRAGDTLYIRAGTYGEGIYNPPSGSSWSSPVTIAAYSGESVTVKPGNSTTPVNLAYQGSYLRYIIFNGLTFDAGRASKQAGNFDGVNYGTSVRYIRFRNCEFKNAINSGILSGRGANYLEFIGCKVHDNGSSTQYDHGLYLQSSDSLIEECDIYDNASTGIHIYTGISGDSANRNIVRNNRVHDNTYGVILGSGDGNSASNNFIYNHPSHGIEIGFNSTNAQCYNNTVYNNGGEGIQIRGASSNTTVQNNTSYSNGIANIANYAGSTTTFLNNLTTAPN